MEVLVKVSSRSFHPGLSGWTTVTDVLYISLPCFNFITMIFVYIFGINKNIHNLHRCLVVCFGNTCLKHPSIMHYEGTYNAL